MVAVAKKKNVKGDNLFKKFSDFCKKAEKTFVVL